MCQALSGRKNTHSEKDSSVVDRQKVSSVVDRQKDSSAVDRQKDSSVVDRHKGNSVVDYMLCMDGALDLIPSSPPMPLTPK